MQQAASRYPEALASYQRAAMLHRRLGDRSREALAWRGTGETYRRLGRHEEAVAFHRRAAAVHEELGDAWNRGVELDCLATALLATDPAQARRCWREARDLLAAFDDTRANGVRSRIDQHLGGAHA
ncbi:tetratricopeptide repeat protein [Actinacidiphila sp. DG2A-62]|uniref:tetratricopeptide repeat protein n=1 Tax=Actinacidiphila sp. DG2A-62 TaxID=3108821 RepID=UPI003FA39A9A